MFEYSAEVLRIVDGDTLDAEIDIGFDVFVKKRIRLFGIDTWESRTKDLVEKKKGLAAKARLKELLQENGNKFLLQSPPPQASWKLKLKCSDRHRQELFLA